MFCKFRKFSAVRRGSSPGPPTRPAITLNSPPKFFPAYATTSRWKWFVELSPLENPKAWVIRIFSVFKFSYTPVFSLARKNMYKKNIWIGIMTLSCIFKLRVDICEIYGEMFIHGKHICIYIRKWQIKSRTTQCWIEKRNDKRISSEAAKYPLNTSIKHKNKSFSLSGANFAAQVTTPGWISVIASAVKRNSGTKKNLGKRKDYQIKLSFWLVCFLQFLCHSYTLNVFLSSSLSRISRMGKGSRDRAGGTFYIREINNSAFYSNSKGFKNFKKSRKNL